MLALILFAALREFLLYGRLLTDWQLLIPGNTQGAEQIRQVDEWFRFTRSQPAAFILLGLLIAFFNWARLWRHTPLRHNSEVPVKRARVTGALKGGDKQAD